jgi:hypothetical protein
MRNKTVDASTTKPEQGSLELTDELIRAQQSAPLFIKLVTHVAFFPFLGKGLLKRWWEWCRVAGIGCAEHVLTQLREK